MGYHRVTFHNSYMYGLNAYGTCCNSFNPFMSYNFNLLYNPFTIFSSAMQLMDGKIPTFTNFYQPTNFQTQLYSNFQLPIISGNIPNFNSLYNGLSIPQTQTYQPQTFVANDLNIIKNSKSDINIDIDNTQKKVYTYQNFSTDTKPFSEKVSSVKTSSAKTYKAKPSSVKTSSTKTYKPIYSTLSNPQLNKEFLDKTKQIAQNINCDYEDLLAVMNSESSLNPASAHKNKRGQTTAVGLIQFTKNYAIPDLNKNYGLDLTVEKIEKMSAIEQLDLVEKYYKITTKKFGGRKLSAADLYASTYLPERATRSTLCRKGEVGRSGKLLGYYEGNSAFDKNRDGKITKSELDQHLSQKRVNLNTFV